MKRKSRLQPAVFIAAAVILFGILVFAAFQVLKIYIPQSNESHGFENLKKEAGLEDINADEALSPADGGSGADEGVLRLAKKKQRFCGMAQR